MVTFLVTFLVSREIVRPLGHTQPWPKMVGRGCLKVQLHVSGRYEGTTTGRMLYGNQLFSGRGFLGLPQKGVSSHCFDRSLVPFIM